MIISLDLRDDQTDYRKIKILKKATKDQRWELTPYRRIFKDADFSEAVNSMKDALSDNVELEGEDKHDKEESIFIDP